LDQLLLLGSLLLLLLRVVGPWQQMDTAQQQQQQQRYEQLMSYAFSQQRHLVPALTWRPCGGEAAPWPAKAGARTAAL
jgi:hypothetical protein